MVPPFMRRFVKLYVPWWRRLYTNFNMKSGCFSNERATSLSVPLLISWRGYETDM
jgi:hypothetical protein